MTTPHMNVMKCTGAFLAERAEVVDGRLNVEGGVISEISREDPTKPVAVTLVVITKGLRTADENPTATLHVQMTHPYLITDSGTILPRDPGFPASTMKMTIAASIPIPESAKDPNQGFLIHPLELMLPELGHYLLVVGEADVEFDVY